MLRGFTWTEKYQEAMSDEHPHRDIISKEILGKNLNVLKNKLLDTATSSYAKIKA